MLVILKLILGPHMEEGRILPFQPSHAQHRTCPGVGFPLKVIIVKPLLPHSHQLHHVDKVDDIRNDKADGEGTKHDEEPKSKSTK